ncbi:MAG: hypothetical protein JSS07_12655 [Proteobacteria bacterium]|nr:hypothetical protein [Pseudomonadota bacterium]
MRPVHSSLIADTIMSKGAGIAYHAPYVLVGAGTASHFAMKGILEGDPNAKVSFQFES